MPRHPSARPEPRPVAAPPHGARPSRGRLARLEREAAARLDRMRRAGRGATGRRLVATELLGVAEALADPALGRHARDALASAYGAAHGVGEAMADCMTCGASWTPGRSPAAVLKVTTTKPDATGLGLVCRACAGLDRAGFEAALLAVVNRDFVAGDARPVPACAFAPAGQA